MGAEAVLRQVIGDLEQAGVSHMLTGSFAGSFHGVPRATQDIDIVIQCTGEQVVDFVQRVETRGFYVSQEAARDAVATRGQFNIIDGATGWKVDLIVRKDRPFSREEFSRRSLEHPFGFALYVATAEDMIVAKLEWARLSESEQQLRDVHGIIRAQGKRLDVAYVRRWTDSLGVLELWDRVFRDAGLPHDQ